MKQHPVIILGAGLAGLTLAYRLKQKGISALILEARNRLGGRIETIKRQNTSLELGATWFADKHQLLNKLLKELDIERIEQEYGKYAVYEMADGQTSLYPLPAQPELTYRIKGGSSVLIDKLAEALSNDQIKLDEPVNSLSFADDLVKINTSKDTYLADRVVSTLPPNLMVEHLRFEPALPDQLTDLSRSTHTWMGESIKAGLFSEKDFWSEKEIGTVYSQRGPVTEMYDHSGTEGFALKGFVHDGYAQLDPTERAQAVKGQLSRFFGQEQIAKTEYLDRVWSEESYTFIPYSTDVFPHQNNGHQLFRKSFYDDRFLLAGSETALAFPGYMDGAVEAAQNTANYILASTEANTVNQ